MKRIIKYPRLKNGATIRLFLTSASLGLIFNSLLLAQSSLELRKESYKLLTVADALKNKDKNCVKAMKFMKNR